MACPAPSARREGGRTAAARRVWLPALAGVCCWWLSASAGADTDAPSRAQLDAVAAAARALPSNPVNPASPANPARAGALQLSVQRAQLVAEGSMLQIRFTVVGATRLPVEPAQTYVLDERTGEHLEVANLVRVGPLAQRRKRADGSSFMVFDNRFGHLAPGGQVSVVVGGLKQEHVVVE